MLDIERRRSASATPFGLRALNPQNCSSSSSLTSTNVSLLTSPQPEKRKVAGWIPLSLMRSRQLFGFCYSADFNPQT
jgi:hypothetical protein